MPKKRFKLAASVALWYAGAAALWILLSDHVVAFWFPDATAITHLQTYKGLGFVSCTAFLLFLSLRWYTRRLEAEAVERRRAEAHVASQHDLYRRAIAAVDAIPYSRVYRTGTYEFMGERIKGVTGYGPEELSGAIWKQLIQETIFYGEAAGLTVQEAARRALAGEIKNWRADHRIRTRSGEIRWISDSSIQVPGPDGKPVGSIGILQDITERKRAEVALRESEARFRQLADSLPTLVWTCTVEGQCDFLNQQWVDYTGVPAEKQLGLGWLEQLHPEDRGRLMEAWGAAVKRGAPFQNEYRLRRHDGSYRWFDDRAVALRDTEGRIVKWFGSSTDMHDQRELRETLRVSEEKLRTIFEAEPECLKLLEADGTLVEINTAGCRMLEADDPAKVLGKSVLTVVAVEYRPGVLAMLEAAVRGEARTMEFQITGLGGTSRWMEMRTVPFRDPSSDRLLVLGVSRDISEIKQSRLAIENSLSLLRATLEATADGILVVNQHGGIASYNQKFVEMWRISPQVMATGAEAKVVASLLDQLADPQAFESGLHAVQVRPETNSQDVVAFKDGRTFERYSQPQRLGGKIVGRVWSFRDVTERKRAERLAVQSELRLRLVWENALHAMRLTDADGIVVLVNNAYCRITGKSRAELEGRPFTLAQAENFRAAAMAEYRERFQRHEERVACATELHFWNGRHAYLEVSDVFLRLSSDSPLQFTIINDVTDRHLAEQRNQVFAEMVHDLSAATSRRAAADLIVAAARRLLGWDACYLYVYDAARDRLENILMRDTINGVMSDVPLPPDDERSFVLLREIIQKGPRLVLRDESYKPDNMVRFGDVQRRSASLMFVPILEAGKTVGVLSIQSYTPQAYTPASLDTLSSLAEHCAGALARIRAEEVVRQNDKRFRSLIENASDLITVISREGTVRFQSPAIERVLGYRPETLLGRRVFDLIHAEDLPRATAALSQALAQPNLPGTFEGRIRHLNGSYRLIQTVGRRATEDAGEETIILNSRDVTESRALEEQFRQAQKMEAIGQLAGGVAHDFNNLLAVILMQAELLKAGTGLAPEHQEAAGEIAKAAQRAANLTRQLLLFSRRQAFKPRDLDLNEVIANVSKFLRRLVGEDVRMQVSYAPQPLFVHADQAMLDQILLNLAVNSRDAMPRGGQLILELSRAEFDEASAAAAPPARVGDFACLRVTDTGEGIAPDVLPHIFEPFFTTKEVGKGTGLGLATVFGIVQQHEGWIVVESQPGQGTSFRVFLPLLRQGRSTPIADTSLASAARGVETILLVEDEAALRLLVRTVLSRLGYRVLEASSGMAALELWQQHHAEIKLLLTDMVMPDGLTGRELALRLLGEKPELKIIYTSGYSQEMGAADFPLRDGENFLAKPFQAVQLAKTVRARLDA